MAQIIELQQLSLVSETTPVGAAVATEAPAAAAVEKKDETVSHLDTYPHGALVPDMNQPKAVKANRRLSTRFMNGIKNFGKKENAATPNEEKAKDTVESKPAEETATTSEAPKLEKPVPAEPLKIEEVSSV